MKWSEKLAMFILLTLLLLFISGSRIICIITSEHGDASSIASWMSAYSKSNQGRTIQQWQDLNQLENFHLNGTAAWERMTRRFIIVSPHIPLTTPEHGDIVAVYRSSNNHIRYENIFGVLPMASIKSRGCYVVCKTPDGEFASILVTDEYLQQIFKTAGMQAPRPQDEPSHKDLAMARLNQLLWAMIPLSCIGFMIRYACREHINWRIYMYYRAFKGRKVVGDALS